MVKRAALLGVAMLLGACAAPELSSADAIDEISASMARAGLPVDRVRLVTPAPAGTFRAAVHLEDGDITVTLDRRSGAYRRIEVGEDAAVTNRQLRVLAAQHDNPAAKRARIRRVTLITLALGALAAGGLGLARRARLREARDDTAERD